MLVIRHKKGNRLGSLLRYLRAPFAEGEGFKPPIPERGIPDFESSAIDHSANLPINYFCFARMRMQRYYFFPIPPKKMQETCENYSKESFANFDFSCSASLFLMLSTISHVLS